MIRVPDVSYCQGVIDWEQVYQEYKRGSISAITIRCGYGDNIPEQDDTYWLRNIKAAVKYKIPYAVYLYSYAYNETMARSEAEHVLRLIKGYKPFRVYYDIEEARYGYAAKLIMDVFGKIIKDAGYQPAVCTYESYFNTYMAGYTKYPLWIAKYSTAKPVVGVPYEAWQYSSSETLPGIGTRVDMSRFEKKIWEDKQAPAKEPAKETTTKVTAEQIVRQAVSWIGCKESDGSFRKIIDTYNAHKPLALGYKVQYTDEWCATFVSAVAIKCNATDIIPTECGCERMINLFKGLGEWQESDAYVPAPGDIIFYDWDDTGIGDDKGFSDHVGIVESCTGKYISVIEGNANEAVARRNIAVNSRYIRGFGVPKYGKTSPAAASTPASTTKSQVPQITYAIQTRNHGTLAATGNGAPLGIANDSILKVRIKVSSGSVQYRVHHHNGKWSRKVKNGTWIGDGVNSLDAIQIYYTTDVSKTGGRFYEAAYAVKPYDQSGFLPEVYDTDWQKTDGDQTAGWFGRPFTEIKIKLKKC